jgi:glycosyltransferase involved in cell wall biosynthesis
MARILLSAYACEPGRGSEPAVGWNWATELARQGHDVTVLTRRENRRAIELGGRALSGSLGFLYYDLPAWTLPLRRIPGGRKICYVLWQWFAARMLRHCFPQPPFDLVQHVTYVSARYPSFMGSLGLPFYFGPVSGGEAVPRALRSGFSFGEQLRETLRDLSNWLVRFDPMLRRTFRQATRILVTHDTLRLLPLGARCKATQTLAIALPTVSSEFDRPSRLGSHLRLLYVGRLLDWKGVHLALRATKKASQIVPGTTLTIVGSGPAKRRLHHLCQNLQLCDAVHWAGWVPQSEIATYYQNADLLLFPSLRDSGGMVVLEALAHGLPVVTTDLGGPGLIVNRSCGRTVATAGCTPNQLVERFCDSLLEIVTNHALLETLSRGAQRRAHDFTFERLVQTVYSLSSARPASRHPASSAAGTKHSAGANSPAVATEQPA